MLAHVMFTLILLIAILGLSSAADLKVLSTTSSSIEWDLEGSLEPGKKYTAEVLLDKGTGRERVIDEPIRSNMKTYRAINLKSNRVYQLQIRTSGVKGVHAVSPPTFTNLKCYSCAGERDADSCIEVVECSANERHCYTKIRYSSKGGRFLISKGCKVSTDVCKPNMERIKIQREANSETGELTDEQILKTMPGLRFFGNLEKLFKKSPSILKRVKKKYNENKRNMLPNALKANCSKREDPTDFCRCCCNAERCNHGMMDCGMTDPPELRDAEPLPPDISTTTQPTTTTMPPPPKIAPICRNFNGGCDHICIAVNKTSVRCKCYYDYKLQQDGRTCKTHLLHAVADAGPDIEITLPRNSITISAINTKGAVKRYKWWAPIAYGDAAGLSVSNESDRDLKVVNLNAGTYKFILTVTGMDGRRSTDMMTLTVKPHPSTVNYTKDDSTKKKKPVKSQVMVLGQSRFSSAMRRKEYKSFAKAHNVTTVSPPTTSPLLLFSTKPTTPKIILSRPRITRPKTTIAEPTKETKYKQSTPKSRRNKDKPTRRPSEAITPSSQKSTPAKLTTTTKRHSSINPTASKPRRRQPNTKISPKQPATKVATKTITSTTATTPKIRKTFTTQPLTTSQKPVWRTRIPTSTKMRRTLPTSPTPTKGNFKTSSEEVSTILSSTAFTKTSHESVKSTKSEGHGENMNSMEENTSNIEITTTNLQTNSLSSTPGSQTTLSDRVTPTSDKSLITTITEPSKPVTTSIASTTIRIFGFPPKKRPSLGKKTSSGKKG